MLVAAQEWERKIKRRGNLAEFFASSPLGGARVELKRLTGKVRKPEL